MLTSISLKNIRTPFFVALFLITVLAIISITYPLPSTKSVSQVQAKSNVKITNKKDKKLTFLESKLEFSQQKHGTNSVENIKRLRNISVYYYNKSKYKKSIEWQNKAISISKKHYGERYYKTLKLNTELASIYYGMGLYIKARKTSEDALATLESLYGNNDKKLILALDLYSEILNSLGEFELAKKHSIRAVNISKKHNGKDNLSTLKLREGLSVIYVNLGDYKSALRINKELLRIYTRLNGENDISAAWALLNLSFTYRKMNLFHESSQHIKKAYAIAEKEYKTSDKRLYSFVRGYASLHSNVGEYKKAIIYYERIDKAFLSIYGKEHLAVLRNKIQLANMYNFSGDYAKALMLIKSVISITEKISDYHVGITGQDYYSLANIYFNLGKYKQANLTVKKAINKEVGDNSNLAKNMSLQASIYFKLLKNNEAISTLQNSIDLLELKQGAHSYELIQPVTFLAYINIREKKLIKAEHLLQRAESIQKKYIHNGVVDDGVDILNIRAILYEKQGEYAKAIDLYQKILSIQYSSDQSDSISEAIILSNLSISYFFKGDKPTAIVLQKMAVNIIQDKRSSIGVLNSNFKNSFKQSHSDIYRTLIHMLYYESRVPEALEIHRMLKENEYLEYARSYSSLNVTSTASPFTRIEKTWVSSYQALVDGYKSIIKLLPSNLENIGLKRQELNTEYFDKISNKISGFSLVNKNISVNSPPIMTNENVAKGHANIFYTVSKDALHITVITKKQVYNKNIAVTKINLGRLTHHYIKSMNNVDSKAKENAKKLYDVLIKPLEEELKSEQIKSLHFSLDGLLRYVSMPTLYDGSDFLINNYDVSLLALYGNSRYKRDNNKKLKFAGFGITLGSSNFSPLDSVESELDEIIKTSWYDTKGLFSGNIYLDNNFTKQSFYSELKNKINFLHLSTHFVLDPVSIDNSYMLMGNNVKLPVSDFINKKTNLSSVELLTLAACETGVGTIGADGREIESFAAVTLKSGAKNVLATLWQVPDKATSKLMIDLYKNIYLNPKGKALALAKAQREMIKNPKYSHPHYWGGFVMYTN